MTMFILFAALGPAPEMARPTIDMNYAAMLERSDLVVVAVFASERAEKEPIDADLKGFERHVEVVTTKLQVLCVLKGDPKTREAAVRHHRMRREDLRVPGGGMDDDPMFAEFRAKNDYLVFLKKRADGRYECVTPKLDTADSVKRLEPRHHVELDPRTGKPR